MLNTTSIYLGLIFGAMGFAFLMYGKKQRAVVPLFCGLLLMLLPYLITNTTVLILLGVSLCILPYFIRR